MKYQGVDYCELMGDKRKYAEPKLKSGDAIKVLYDDENPPLPSIKSMKRGNYVVVSVDSSFTGDRKVYVLLKNGAKHKYHMHTIAIDKAIDAGMIEVEYT